MKPLIGITMNYDDAGTYFSISLRYSRAIALSGGIPVMLPYVKECDVSEELVNNLDGILFSGGDDLYPGLYGETMIPECGAIELTRDWGEKKLFDAAVKKKIPVFGICRGIQAINVYSGGTLYQDLQTQMQDVCESDHRQRPPYCAPCHTNTIIKGTALSDILGGEQKVGVNSTHHQSVKDAAPGFTINAISENGVIEGIEKMDESFILGVQWHPEHLYGYLDEAKPLFDAFVNAAKAYKSAH